MPSLDATFRTFCGVVSNLTPSWHVQTGDRDMSFIWAPRTWWTSRRTFVRFESRLGIRVWRFRPAYQKTQLTYLIHAGTLISDKSVRRTTFSSCRMHRRKRDNCFRPGFFAVYPMKRQNFQKTWLVFLFWENLLQSRDLPFTNRFIWRKLSARCG